MMLHPFKQRHLLVQVHQAEGLPFSETDLVCGLYCQLNVGPLRMSTSAVRGERRTHSLPPPVTSASPVGAVDLLCGGPSCPPAESGVLTPSTTAVDPLLHPEVSSPPPPSRTPPGGNAPPSSTLSPASSVTSQPGSMAAGSGSGSSAGPPLPPPSRMVTWGDRFILREDDLIQGDMALMFEVMMAKRWPAPDAALGAVEMVLDEEIQSQLLSGKEVRFVKPLSGKVTPQQQRKAVPSAFASSAAATSISGSTAALSSSGHLVFSLRLQQTALDDAMSGQLPADLLPAITLEAVGLPPGSLVHSALATTYVEPCVVLLRIRLLSVVGLKFLPKAPLNSAASKATASKGDLSAPLGPGATSGSGKQSQQETKLSDQVQEWSSHIQKGGNDLIKAAGEQLAKRWGIKWGGTKSPPPPATTATTATAALHRSHDAKSSNATAAAKSRQPAATERGPLGREVPLESEMTECHRPEGFITHPDLSLQASAAAAAAAATAAAATLRPPGSAPETSSRTLQKGFDIAPIPPPSLLVEGNGPVLAPITTTAAPSPPMPPPAPPFSEGHQAHKPSVDFDVLMNVLETNGFSYTDKGIFSYFWCKVDYEGQEHTSRMIQQDKGSVSWGEAECLVLAALRPVGDSPVELSLYGSRDVKSRGKPVCQVSIPLRELLEAAGIGLPSLASPDTRTTSAPPLDQPTSSRGGGGDRGEAAAGGWRDWLRSETTTSAVRGVLAGKAPYDPQFWPHGRVTIKGKLGDGSGVELSLEVSVIDSDERATSWSQPLLRQPATPAMTPNVLPSVAPHGRPPQASPSTPTPVHTAPAAAVTDSGLMTESLVEGGGASVEGRLHVIVHSVDLDPTEYPKPVDCFFVLKCGNVWTCSTPTPPSRAPSWGVHCHLPVTHPSDLVSVALYKRSDLGLGGKQGLSSLADLGGKKGGTNVRVMGQLMGLAGGSLMGKLRIRMSTLAPGKLHTVDLPLQGERLQSRVGPRAGLATLSILLEVPHLAPNVISYFKPQIYPAVQILSMGCVAGDDLRSPFVGDGSVLAVDADLLNRRCRRAVLGWLEVDCTPGVPHRVAKKLLDDGRQDFTLSRTKQNWRRLMFVLSLTKPLVEWWKLVRSWRSPALSLAVVTCIVLWAAFPSRGAVVALVALAVLLGVYRVRQYPSGPDGSVPGAPMPMVEDLPADNDDPPPQSSSGTGGSDGGGGGAVHPSRSQPALTDLTSSSASAAGSSSLHSLGTSPPSPTAESSSLGGGASSAAGRLMSGFIGGAAAAAASSVVPLDTFEGLKETYDGVIGFLSMVQNVLDTLASSLERLQALLTWQDPLATSILVTALLTIAMAIWLIGLPAVLAAAVLCDLLPPPLRDPLPGPVLILFRYLPTRRDRMM